MTGVFFYDFVMSAYMSVSERITLMTTQSHILRVLSSNFLRSVGFGGNTGQNTSLLLTSADMDLVTAAPNATYCVWHRVNCAANKFYIYNGFS